MLAVSLAWHVLAAALRSARCSWPTGPDRLAAVGRPVRSTGLFVLLAARAAVVPRRWPHATPMAVGLGEVAASTALALLLIAAS